MNPEAANLTHKPQEDIQAGWARIARPAWVLLAFLAFGVFLTSLPGYLLFYRQGFHTQAGATAHNLLSVSASILAFMASFSMAALLYRRKWNDRMGPFISFYLLAYSIVMAGPLESWSFFWLGSHQLMMNAQAIIMSTPTLTLMALFPTGRFVPAWMRWFVVGSLSWIAIVILFPISELYTASTSILFLYGFFVLSILAPGVYAQIYRYRRVSSFEERQQTKWVVFALLVWSLYIVLSTGPYFYIESLPPEAPLPWWSFVTSLGWWLSLNILPISLTVAVLRYRLWDIDIFINRALVSVALTAAVIGIYVLVVGSIGLLFQAQFNWLMALIATGLVAVLFQPLRERLQRGVNRILYGRRDEPFTVLTQLGKKFESALTPDKILPTLVETISQTLKLPYVAITLKRGDQFSVVESYGKPVEDPILFPLIYQGRYNGQLLVARRAPNEAFSEAEIGLIRNIAVQAGAAINAIQLTGDLQRSRQQSVAALEDERRRIRRDLHDGLGPTLAALMLKAGAARAILGNSQPSAGRLLEELENDLEDTLHQVRSLVYNLRPPALDQLGLAGAIKDYAEQVNQTNRRHNGEDDSRLIISVSAPECTPSLPAAVEVAAYRIVQEGLANVVRHSGASRCQVELECGDSLHLTIRDDGNGLPDGYRPGLGLTSMQERAEELGGRCLVKAAPERGLEISAIIPMSNH
jgi:signal transduction histidine kinase